MTTNQQENREAIRYSEAFKMSVVRELEAGGLAFNAIKRKYGIKGTATVPRWVKKYGNGTRGKVIRVEKPDEMDQQRQLKERVRALERAYTEIACERAGIADVAEFKKKAAGLPGIKP